ncbi:MAG TPA: metalloregulator ArsR/SmtB family transcription factor [Rhodothermales bacterium]|nr:metalloregulator ArsR/SmtB family transcription factor [Rhodothermales bacterium]
MTEIGDGCAPTEMEHRAPFEGRDVDRLAAILKALAHPVRIRMVDLISRGGCEICVCEVEEHFDLKQPTISHHLRILRDAGLIRSRQDGTWVRHSIDAETFALAERLLGRLVGAYIPSHLPSSQRRA